MTTSQSYSHQNDFHQMSNNFNHAKDHQCCTGFGAGHGGSSGGRQRMHTNACRIL